jgi:hypothetical protein
LATFNSPSVRQQGLNVGATTPAHHAAAALQAHLNQILNGFHGGHASPAAFVTFVNTVIIAPYPTVQANFTQMTVVAVYNTSWTAITHMEVRGTIYFHSSPGVGVDLNGVVRFDAPGGECGPDCEDGCDGDANCLNANLKGFANFGFGTIDGTVRPLSDDEVMAIRVYAVDPGFSRPFWGMAEPGDQIDVARRSFGRTLGQGPIVGTLP